jgi:hypothetical protein
MNIFSESWTKIIIVNVKDLHYTQPAGIELPYPFTEGREPWLSVIVQFSEKSRVMNPTSRSTLRDESIRTGCVEA